MNIENRTIFEGDNLDILRGIDTDSIDLIYLDPPYNSNQIYKAPIGSEAAGAAFKDTWTLSDIDSAWHGQLAEQEPALYYAISAGGETHGNSMKAYLVMMGIRMLEIRRILKPSGSIYLHCDPTASHYLKIMMDSIFGHDNFRNNIIWRRIGGAGKTTQHKAISYGRSVDHILFYAYPNSKFDINSDLVPFSEDYLKNFKYRDKKGPYARRSPFNSPGQGTRPNQCYEYKGFFPPHPSGWNVTLDTLKKMDQEGELEFVNGKVYRKLRLKSGMPANNLWLDIPPALGKERLGYPTQKPLKLLERIIKASSNRGDVVLDPFCGCATTCIAAEKLQRQWIGIDLSPKAVELVKTRLEREVDLTEHPNLLGRIKHRTDIPKRSYSEEPRQIHIETLFGPKDITDLVLSEVELGTFRSHKHTLYGKQEGKCNGCEYSLPFRNMTIDHIIPRSKDGGDEIGNLQLLCHTCNSIKGNRTHEYLIQRLREDGTLR